MARLNKKLLDNFIYEENTHTHTHVDPNWLWIKNKLN